MRNVQSTDNLTVAAMCGELAAHLVLVGLVGLASHGCLKRSAMDCCRPHKAFMSKCGRRCASFK